MGLPGNIRELQNVIERAVILSTGQDLQVPLGAIQPPVSRRADGPQQTTTFHDAERQTILKALRESEGIVAGAGGAASRLGLKRTTLQSKMRKLGIRRPGY